MDQHIKISDYKKDIETLVKGGIEKENKHFKEITSLKANITLLKIERVELNTNIAALEKALDRMSGDLINTKADLIILRKEYGL